MDAIGGFENGGSAIFSSIFGVSLSMFWFRFMVNISSVFQRFFLDCSVKFQFDFRLSFRHFCWRLGRWLVQLIFNPFQIDLERFLAVSKLIFSFERSPIEIWNLLMSNVWLVFSQNLVSLPIIFISDFDWFSVGVEQIDGELRLKMNRVRIGFDCLNDDLLRRQFLNVVSRRLVQYLVVASVVSHRTMTLEFIELIF